MKMAPNKLMNYVQFMCLSLFVGYFGYELYQYEDEEKCLEIAAFHGAQDYIYVAPNHCVFVKDGKLKSIDMGEFAWSY